MNKKELDEYCLSLGLVQSNTGGFCYGYIYPFKYACTMNLLVRFQYSIKEILQGKLNETVQRTIKIANKVMIDTKHNLVVCYGFDVIENSDEEIKKKIYKMVKQYEKVIGDFKKYRIKSKVKEIEGDFE